MTATSYVNILGTGLVSSFGADENAALSALFPRLPLRRIPRYARMGLLAGATALAEVSEEASVTPADHANIGLVVGSAYAGIQMSMDFMDSILDAEPRLSSPTAFSHAVNNMGAGLLSLYLGLRGPCHTVTQFSLSFVGALHMAQTLIHAGRATHVLVGCMEENEGRFTALCNAQHVPLLEGAAFFLVGKADAHRPRISVAWNHNSPQAATKTGTATREDSPLAGETSLHHAQSLHAFISSPPAQATQTLLCHDARTRVTATIQCTHTVPHTHGEQTYARTC